MTWSETREGHRLFQMVLHRDSDVGLLMSKEQAEYVTRCLVATVPEHPNDRRLRQITLRGLDAAKLGRDVWDEAAPVEADAL